MSNKPIITESLPHSLDAERIVIGCILQGEIQWLKILTQKHFYEPVYGLIFQTLLDAWVKDGYVDFLIASDLLKGNEQIEALGGTAYLAELAILPTTSVGPSAVKILQEKHAKRISILSARKLEEFGKDLKHDVRHIPQLLADAGRAIHGLLPRPAKMEHVEIIEELQTPDVMTPTGFLQMDKILGGGLIAGGLFLIAARPKVGKTALATNILANLIKADISATFISLEMSRKQILQRVICAYFDIGPSEAIAKCQELIPRMNQQFNITIGTHGLNQILQEIYTTEARCVIVDYFGLITTASRENRFQQMDDISRSLKNAARETGKPVILLTQLNREVEKDKTGRRPRLSDLWGGGEKDADVISILHNPNLKEEAEDEMDGGPTNTGTDNGELEWIVRANRHGPTGYVKLYFDKPKFLMREEGDAFAGRANTIGHKPKVIDLQKGRPRGFAPPVRHEAPANEDF